VRALARSNVRDLTVVVDIGGPDVEVLLATGKVRRLIYAYVGFEVFGLAPWFRRTREQGPGGAGHIGGTHDGGRRPEGEHETGNVLFEEWSESTVLTGLDAAVKGVPFLPTRAGLGTDLLRVNPSFRTVVDTFGGEELVAVPAIRPDVALLHVNLADPSGYGVILGDAHGDVLMAKAARRTLITAERILPREDVLAYGRDVRISRLFVAGVAEAPFGAHPTGVAPYYRFDAPCLLAMQDLGRTPEALPEYAGRFVAASEAAYLEAQGGRERMLAELSVF